MKTKILDKRNIISGIVAGLIAGVVFGFILARMDILSYAGRFLGLTDPLSGFIIHLIFSAVVGVVFALVFFRCTTKFFSSALSGIAYGIIWWLIGPFILCPWMKDLPISWTSAEMCYALPMLIGHLVFGIVLGVTYFWMKNRK